MTNEKEINDIETLLKEIQELRKENGELKTRLYDYLPADCDHGYSEIKFCPSRLSGDGLCKICFEK